MFAVALEELKISGASLSKPESFSEYCIRTGQAVPRNVPGWISAQTLSTLNRELRQAKVMIYRLGAPPGSNTTQFGLARIVNDWSDYFLLDEQVFADVQTQAFIPTSSYRDLYAFSLIPRFTETTTVNFALASASSRK